MRKIKKCFLPVVAFIILIVLAVPVFSSASCAHSSLGPLYCEATHPHEYYNQCKSCGVKIYTGEYATKDHGDGTWGSWTCPDCGTHTYVGRTCTEEGICVCGDTVAAYGHSYGYTVYYTEAHPHRAYVLCSRCGAMSYTGGAQSRPHGDGSNGTCNSCGSHSYEPDSLDSTLAQHNHPHSVTQECVCGSSYEELLYYSTCTSCTADTTTAFSSSPKSGVLYYLDGDDSIGVPISVPVTLYVEYTNMYKYPSTILQNVICPAFASSLSKVSVRVEGAPFHAPEIIATATVHPIPYHNGQGGLIAEQSVSLTASGEAVGGPSLMMYTLDVRPSYTEVKGVCSLLNGWGDHIEGSTRTYFN